MLSCIPPNHLLRLLLGVVVVLSLPNTLETSLYPIVALFGSILIWFTIITTRFVVLKVGFI
jgi:hypothetical protein